VDLAQIAVVLWTGASAVIFGHIITTRNPWSAERRKPFSDIEIGDSRITPWTAGIINLDRRIRVLSLVGMFGW
jgi:hypothetical protein